MIPKIIHLCWFGKKEYPPLVRYCLNSWHEHLNNYKIMIWNEETFDIGISSWTKESYENKKWAFVSDYVRAWALYHYGGVYLDTDIEVLKDFYDLIKDEKYVSSFVEGVLPGTSFIACEKNHWFMKRILDYYQCRHFIDCNGSLNQVANPLIFAKMAIDCFSLKIGVKDFKNDEIVLYNSEYFLPYKKNLFLEKTNKKSYIITKKTYTIHHDMGSWEKGNKVKKFFKGLLRLLLPSRIYLFIKKKKYIKEINKIKIDCIN